MACLFLTSFCALHCTPLEIQIALQIAWLFSGVLLALAYLPLPMEAVLPLKISAVRWILLHPGRSARTATSGDLPILPGNQPGTAVWFVYPN